MPSSHYYTYTTLFRILAKNILIRMKILPLDTSKYLEMRLRADKCVHWKYLDTVHFQKREEDRES